MNKKKKISIIICCYNEQGNIPTVVNAIEENMNKTGYEYEIIAVNDGSNDDSQTLLEKLAEEDPRLFYIELSRNFGHQNALKAGLDLSTGDAIISMDADMQHPPSMLPELIKKWEEGYDIVYTRRITDRSAGKMKTSTSHFFYKFINSISEIELEEGTADFRLMCRQAANVIVNMKGGDLFIRGIVSWMGFKRYGIDYTPDKRLSGKTKYTLKKMLKLATQGILSFSSKPLHLTIYFGIIISALSLLFIPYACTSLIRGHAHAGWVSLILTISFLGGLQLFILGILGLYIGNIFSQTRGMPPYIIQNTNISSYEK